MPGMRIASWNVTGMDDVETRNLGGIEMERRCGLGSRALLTAVVAGVMLGLAVLAPSVAGATSASKTALLDGQSVTTADGIVKGEEAISLEQWAAENAGFAVTVKSGEEWEKMTAAEFAQYQLLIVGDPDCRSTALSAVNSAPTWTPVVMGNGPNPLVGNRAVVGTDPEYHYAAGGGGARPTEAGNPASAGAEHLVQDGITFAGAVVGATGVYFDTSCSDLAEAEEDAAKPATSVIPNEIHQPTVEGPDGLDKTQVLEHLTLEPGKWTENTSPPCGGSVSQVATNSAFGEGPTKLLDSDIQGWGCSDHITFPQFPTDWAPLAVATDTPSTPTCGRDPEPPNAIHCGESYVLLAGEGILAEAPNLALTPKFNSNLAGGTHSITAIVAGNDHTPTPGVVVTFLLTGTNRGVAGTCTTSAGAADPECKTDEAGKVVFTYSDVNGVGKDTITASAELEIQIEEERLELEARPAAVRTVKTAEHTSAVQEWTPLPVVATATKAATAVLTEKVVKTPAGSASAARVVGCTASRSYLAAVRGAQIASVRFVLDGHTVGTVLHATGSGTFALRLRLKAGSKHHLAMHVTFTAASKTGAVTLKRTLARCAAAKPVAKPRFTG